MLEPLGEGDRHRLNGEWRATEVKFIDSPNEAVRSADALIEETLRLCGFPSTDFDQRLADISVDHPFAVEHYRAARQIWRDGDRAPEVDAEGLRQAMRHYHLVFAELADGVSHASAHDDDDALACRHGEGGEFAFEDDGIAGPDRRATSCTTGSGRSARSRTPTKVRTTVRSRR